MAIDTLAPNVTARNFTGVPTESRSAMSLQLELQIQQQRRICTWADRFFGWLMVLQFFALLATAAWISPLTWSGTNSAVHTHVWAALLLGGCVTLFPAALAFRYPGTKLSRYSIAVGQMLVSALLIHFTGGRLESHFHVFGSLAFLAIYRDWRLIIIGTLVTAADHLIRAAWWPESLFGVEQASVLLALEHAGWVIFEDIVLLISIRQSVLETRRLCETISEVAEFSDRVEQSSELLSETSAVLAEGAANQRTDVETISASIDQLTNATLHIRQLAEQLDQSADDARSLAESGSTAAGHSDTVMSSIEAATREMATVVGDVRKISEQTNLLALNATIEASRAGSAGRGFAVVATQVKELANRSRESAIRVTGLIEESLNRTQEGVAASHQSREQLTRIMQSVDSTVDRIRDILAATNSQTAVASDVTQAVEALASVSARTAANSGEMAGNSRNLQESAAQLTTIIGRFRSVDAQLPA